MKNLRDTRCKRLQNGEIKSECCKISQSNPTISIRSDLTSTYKASAFPSELILCKKNNNTHNWMRFDTTKYFPISIYDEFGNFLDVECDITAKISLSSHLNNAKTKNCKYDNCVVTGSYKTAKMAGTRIPARLQKGNATPVYWFASLHVYAIGEVNIHFSCEDRPDITPLEINFNVIENNQPNVRGKERANIRCNKLKPTHETKLESKNAFERCISSKINETSKYLYEEREEFRSLVDLVFDRSLIAVIQHDKDQNFGEKNALNCYQPTVKEIIDSAITYRMTHKVDTENCANAEDNKKYISSELGSRLLILFDTLLEHRLLYEEELEYYHAQKLFFQLKNSGIRPSSWFGATHFLRMVLHIINGPKLVAISQSTVSNNNSDLSETKKHQQVFLDFDISLLGDVIDVKSLLESCLLHIPLMLP